MTGRYRVVACSRVSLGAHPNAVCLDLQRMPEGTRPALISLGVEGLHLLGWGSTSRGYVLYADTQTNEPNRGFSAGPLLGVDLLITDLPNELRLQEGLQ